MNIFVGSLPFKVVESELKEVFEEFGEVTTVKIITDRETGRSKGFGFIEMPDDEAAKKAISEINGAELYGRTIVVNQAEDKKERPSGGGGGGYSRGGSGGGGGYNRGGNSGGGGGGYNRGGGGESGYRR
jgi:RNA recognition motif-containing protein